MSKTPKKADLHTKPSKVSWVVFLSTLAVVLISLISVIFPALLVRSTSILKEADVNAFEIGVWTTPFIIVNVILLAVSILYFKNKLPHRISSSINFIFNFETSKKVTFIIFLAILAIYVGLSASELTTEETWLDYSAVRNRVYSWFVEHISIGFETHLRYFLLSTSFNIFGNIRVIPFIASITLIILTYYITKDIAKKRFAGLVAATTLLQSNVFLSYDTTASYDNFWILLYIFSLYMINKKWFISPISYVLSITTKALTTIFLPMTLFFIYRSEIGQRKKIMLIISYVVIIIALISTISILKADLISGNIEVDNHDFWQGFASWAYQLRFDAIVLIFLLPLTIGLFLVSRKGVVQADSILILIMGILLASPLLSGLTTLTNQPYRFVPLVVFFAIGVGTILAKRTNGQA